MKRIFLAIALCLTGFQTLTTTASGQAAAPAASQSTGQLTLKMLNHLKKVYTLAASAKDKATAESAAAAIQAELKKVDALSPLLAKAAKPTQKDMAAVAEATAKMEADMNKQIQTMVRNLKNSEVRKLISPQMQQFAAKANAARKTIDSLYPAKEMLPLVKAAKARIEIKSTSN